MEDNLKIQKALEMDKKALEMNKKALEMDNKALEIDHLKTKLDFTRKELLRTAGLLSSLGILEFYAKRMCEIPKTIKPKSITATLAAAYEYQQISSAARDLVVCVTECGLPKENASSELKRLYQKLCKDVHGYPWQHEVEIDSSLGELHVQIF